MALKNKSLRRANAPVKDKIPLVSVIIPMYNSAKFIPQTLESLLYQTMKDFEVVVVDDCSKDNSVEVVEGFKPRFDSQAVKLHIVKLPKNTGTPGISRNLGINFACGKYIAFLDSDDLFTKTALEELTTLAEEYQAEIVRMYNHWVLWEEKARFADDPAFTDMTALTNSANWSLRSERPNAQLSAPVLISQEVSERLKLFLNQDVFWSSVVQFYRRDFLVSNKLSFSPMLKSEDAPFIFECLLATEKYLLVPNVTYIVRPRLDSASRTNGQQINLENYFHKNIAAWREGFNEFERVMKKFPFFSSHVNYRYAVLDFFFQRSFSRHAEMWMAYTQIPPFRLNELVKREFHPDDAAFSAYLFNTVNVYRLQLMKFQQENLALKNELQKYRSAK